jgi:hypothetical protein
MRDQNQTSIIDKGREKDFFQETKDKIIISLFRLFAKGKHALIRR